ncbi:MAG: hypothetical protein ACLUUO_09415 [Sellimonas intestinalis]
MYMNDLQIWAVCGGTERTLSEYCNLFQKAGLKFEMCRKIRSGGTTLEAAWLDTKMEEGVNIALTIEQISKKRIENSGQEIKIILLPAFAGDGCAAFNGWAKFWNNDMIVCPIRSARREERIIEQSTYRYGNSNRGFV